MFTTRAAPCTGVVASMNTRGCSCWRPSTSPSTASTASRISSRAGCLVYGWAVLELMSAKAPLVPQTLWPTSTAETSPCDFQEALRSTGGRSLLMWAPSTPRPPFEWRTFSARSGSPRSHTEPQACNFRTKPSTSTSFVPCLPTTNSPAPSFPTSRISTSPTSSL